MLPGKESLLEIAKQVLKLGAIAYVAYSLIADAMPMLVVLSAASPMVSAAFVGGLATKLLIHVGGAFLLVAVFDYWLALRKANEDAMMSKQEVKDERKGEEASPELRGRVRRRMRELAKNRALADMSKATVLITNPTHYAVALRYLPSKDHAPIVLAKGRDELAFQMREQARRHQVPMVENRPLARALYADGRAGHPIPLELFRGVAEVIAFVMKLSATNAGRPMLKGGES
jgi:flagellar biosynthetic protein FlhB